MGGKYGISHGFANAVLLPVVLDEYGKSAYKPLAKLARLTHLADKSDGNETAAKKFIDAVRELNGRLSIPSTFEGKIAEQDFDELAQHADKEANPLYPVPKLMNKNELKQIYYKVL